MVTDQEVDEFIEHFGIKGMRWGVRNQQNLERVNRVARGTELRKVRNRRIVKRVAIVGGTVAATALVSTILARRGMISVSKANQLGSAKAAKALMDVHKHVKMRMIAPEVADEVRRFAQTF